jgi:hypothetical protein
MGLLDLIPGYSAGQAAKEQSKLANNANAFTQQQWYQVGLPMAQMQMQNMQKMQPFQNQMLSWLTGSPVAQTQASPMFNYGGQDYNVGSFVPRNIADQIARQMPGSVQFGNRGAGGDGYTITNIMKPTQQASTAPAQTMDKPWWMNTQPVGNDVTNALSTLSRINLNKAAQGESNNMAMFNAARGVNTSSEQATKLPGFNRAMLPMRAQETANRALTIDQMNTQRRGEAGNNYWNMANWLQGSPAYQNPNSTVMPWASMYQNMGANAQNAAAQYGAQSANALGSLGSIAGMYLGSRNQPQQQTGNLYNIGQGANISSILPWLMMGR